MASRSLVPQTGKSVILRTFEDAAFSVVLFRVVVMGYPLGSV